MTSTIVLLISSAVAFHAAGKPVTSMTSGPKGTIEFQTLTLSAEEFWAGAKTPRAVTISGELLLPKGDGRVPAVIMSHGGSGISGIEETWARELRSMDIAAFVVDSFSGRGIKKQPADVELSPVGQVYDVYQALALLATHPRIDRDRIALMGPSRGGGVTLFAAMTRSLQAQRPEGVDFCGYLTIYPGLYRTIEGPFASRPIRIFTGTADEIIRISMVREFAEKYRAAGADIRVVEYDGAHHAFDNPEIRQPFVMKTPTASFTLLYNPQAHAKLKRDMKETLSEVFGKQ